MTRLGALACVLLSLFFLLGVATAGEPVRNEVVPQFHLGGTQLWTTPDGDMFLEADSFGHVALGQWRAGRILRTIATGGGGSAVAADAHCRRLVADAGGGRLGVWDVATGQRLALLAGHSSMLSSIAVTPDGRRAVSGSYSDHRAILWDLDAQKQLLAFATPSAVHVVAIEAQASLAATVCQEDVLLWDASNGKRIRAMACNWNVDQLAFSADGKFLLTSGFTFKGLTSTTRWIVWEVATGQPVIEQNGQDDFGHTAFTPDGKQVVRAGGKQLGPGAASGRIEAWDLATGKQLRTLAEDQRPVTSMAFTADGRQLLSVHHQRAIRWNWPTGKPSDSLAWPQRASLLTVSANATGLVLTQQTPPALWELSTGRVLHTFSARDRIRHLTLAGQRRRVVAVGEDRANKKQWLLVWDAEQPGQLRRLGDVPFSCDRVAITPDGSRAVTSSSGFDAGVEQTTTIVWDLNDGTKLGTFPARQSFSQPVAIGPDGRRVAAAEPSYQVAIYDVATGKAERTLSAGGVVNALAFSPDGRQLAIGCGLGVDATVLVHDVTSGQRIAAIKGASDSINALNYSPDGRHLLAGTWNCQALVWNLADRSLRRLDGHTSWVHSVAFVDRAGRYALTSDMTELRLWDTETGETLASIQRVGETGDWLAMTPSGLCDGSDKAKSSFALRAGAGIEVDLSAERKRPFQHDGLLAALLAGRRPPPPAAEAPSESAARIVSPIDGLKTDADADTMQVEVEVSDKSPSAAAPWLWHNLKRIEQPSAGATAGRYIFRVSLAPGTNRFEAYAPAGQGRPLGQPAVVTVERGKAPVGETLTAFRRPELVVQSGHSQFVTFSALSPDGRWLATGGYDSLAIMWDVKARQQVHKLLGHESGVTCGAFSPDSQRLATGDSSRTLIEWDVATGRRLGSLGHDDYELVAVCYSADGRTLLTATDKQIYQWDAASHARQETIVPGEGRITAMAATAAGDRVATGQLAGEQSSVVLWNTATRQVLRRLVPQPNDRITRLAFAPDHQTLTALLAAGKAISWNVATGELVRTLSTDSSYNSLAYAPRSGRLALAAHSEIQFERLRGANALSPFRAANSLSAVALSPDGRLAIHADGLHDIATIIDTATGQWLKTYRQAGNRAAAFSPDSRRFLLSAEKHLQLGDVATGNYQSIPTDEVRLCGFTADGRECYGISSVSTVTVYNATTGAVARTFDTPYWTHAAALAPDGQGLLVGGSDGQLAVWNLQTGKRLFALPATGEITAVAISHDGRFALSAGQPRPEAAAEIVLWELATRRAVGRFAGGERGCRAVAFDRSAKRAIVLNAYADQTMVDIVDLASGRRLWGIRGAIDDCMATSADGTRLLLAAGSGSQFWDLTQGVMLDSFQANASGIHSLHFTPDEKQIVASGSEPDDVGVIWNLETELPQGALRSSVGAVTAVAFRPDGTKLAIGGDGFGGNVVLWDCASGQVEGVLGGHGGYYRQIHQIVYRPDGRRLAVLSGNSNVVVWDPAARQQTCTARFDAGVLSAVAFSLDGRQIVAVGGTGSANTGVVVRFDAATGALLAQYPVPGPVLKALALEGSQLATGAADDSVVLWDFPSLRQTRTIRDADATHAGVTALRFLAEGRQLLVGYGDGAIVWDLATGKILRKIPSVQETVVTPDGKTLAAMSLGRIATYDLAEGKLTHSLVGHIGSISAMAVSPTGRYLLSGGIDGTARLWDLQKGDELIALIAVRGGADWVTVTPDGLFDGSPGGRRLVAFRVPGAAQPVPLDRFFHDFYRAGLLASLVEGDRVRARLALGGNPPPALKIVSPEDGVATSAQATISIEAADQGGGVAGLALYQNGARLPVVALAELFRHRGPRVHDAVEVRTLVDHDATREGIVRMLRETAAQSRTEDTLVVFLAGHGTMIGQRYYFIPHDLRHGGASWEDDIRQWALPADELSDYLGGAKALKRALIFDTCSASGAVGSIVKGRARFELRGEMERLGRTQGLFTLAAAAANEEAKEASELGHGVLSYTLLAGLKAVGDGPLSGTYAQPTGPARTVRITEWFDYAVGVVPRLTESLYGSAQHVQSSAYGSAFQLLPLDE